MNQATKLANKCAIAGHDVKLLLVLLLALVSVACETQPVQDGSTTVSPEQLEQMVKTGDWAAIASANLSCNKPGDACAAAHAAQADACLRLAIQLPADASATKGRTRRLLDCAEDGYRDALSLHESRGSASVASYHGGLLLTLSERRNRLDASVREQKLDRENQKLLQAAEVARTAVSESALGFIYGASAHVYRALLSDVGRERCNDLRRAETLLERTPPPPNELIDEEQRLRRLIREGLRKDRCSASDRTRAGTARTTSNASTSS